MQHLEASEKNKVSLWHDQRKWQDAHAMDQDPPSGPILSTMRKEPALGFKWITFDNMCDLLMRSGHSGDRILLLERWQLLAPMWICSHLLPNTVPDYGGPMYIGRPPPP